MKKIIVTIAVGFSTLAFSQVIIGDDIGTAPANKKTSVLLEFANTNNKGIVLPTVRSLPVSPNLTEGTILVDASTASTARVKYYNGAWVDLSGKDANLQGFLANQPTVAQTPEDATSKAIIGANSSSADGVLVLESTTKAMVLPTVTDVSNIGNPSPGMMVYVNKAGAKRLAVYNGNTWAFWAAN